MDPITIALIGAQAISGMYGAKKTNETNQRIARETNDLNRFLFYEQNRLNRENWSLANVYNTPLAQRQRYESAGINPALALGNITAGTADSIAPASSHPAVSPPPAQNELATLSQGFTQMADYKLRQEAQRATIDLQNTQAERNKADTVGRSIENEYTSDVLKSQIANLSAQTRKYDMEIEQGNFTIENTRRMTDKQIQMIDAQIAKIVSDVDFQNVMKSVKLYELRNLMPAQRQLLAGQFQHMMACVDLVGSQIKLNDQQVENLVYDKLETIARTNNIEVTTQQLKDSFQDSLELMRSQVNLNNANADYRREETKYYGAQVISNIVNDSLNTAINLGSAVVTGGLSTGLIKPARSAVGFK